MVFSFRLFKLLALAWFAIVGAMACTERVPTAPTESRTPTPAGCTYEISPTTRSHGLTAGSGTVTVTAPSGCRWTVSSNASWLTFAPNSSAGDGIVSYSFAANTGLGREGRLTIA